MFSPIRLPKSLPKLEITPASFFPVLRNLPQFAHQLASATRFFWPQTRPDGRRAREPLLADGSDGQGARRRDMGRGIRPIPGARAVVRDDGSGLGKGVKLERARRRAAGLPDLDDSLDVFHTLREGGRALRKTWGAATRALERADAAQKEFDRRGRQGQSRQGHGAPLNRLWRQAERLWDQATAAETAWKQAKSAFEFFTPEGRLNDRAQAEAVVAAALPHLSGAAWAKTRRLLLRRESFTFLDQVQERLAELGLDPDVLSALLDLEGLRRQPWRLSAATRAWALVRTVQLTKACPDWRDEAGRVRAVLRGVWRASSLVECVNSVARMQQARHRKMTQGLLDLKRLYWNLRRFRTGRRKDQTPYGLLGLKLPELELLGVPQADPGGIAGKTVRDGRYAVRSVSGLPRHQHPVSFANPPQSGPPEPKAQLPNPSELDRTNRTDRIKKEFFKILILDPVGPVRPVQLSPVHPVRPVPRGRGWRRRRRSSGRGRSAGSGRSRRGSSAGRRASAISKRLRADRAASPDHARGPVASTGFGGFGLGDVGDGRRRLSSAGFGSASARPACRPRRPSCRTRSGSRSGRSPTP